MSTPVVSTRVVHDDPSTLKETIREYWEREPCGTRDIPEQDRRWCTGGLGMAMFIEATK